jgi:hypothetical protein
MSLYSKEHIIPVSLFKKYKMTKWKDISPNVQPVHIGLNQFRRNYTFAHWEDHVSSSFLSCYPDLFRSPHSQKLVSILYDDFGLESFQYNSHDVLALRSRQSKLFMPLYPRKDLSLSLLHLQSQYKDWLDISHVIENPRLLHKWSQETDDDDDITTISSSPSSSIQ